MLAGLQEDLLAVDDVDAHGLQGEHHGRLDDVDAERLLGQAVLGQHLVDLRGDVLRTAGGRGDRAAQRGDARAGAVVLLLAVRVPRVEPRRVELVVARGRAEVPEDRRSALGQQGEADHLVHRPRADVGPGHVPDVVEVEGEHRAERGALELRSEPGQPLGSKARHVEPRLPVDLGDAVGGCVHQDLRDRGARAHERRMGRWGRPVMRVRPGPGRGRVGCGGTPRRRHDARPRGSTRSRRARGPARQDRRSSTSASRRGGRRPRR